MISKSTFDFLKQLKKNNEKAWFDAHRPAYQQARKNVEEFAGALISGISKFDPAIAHLEPKACLFRINRDVRFSANKAPYKTNMSVYLSAKGKQAMDVAGYYVHIEPGQSFMAGGIWMPMAPELKKIRQEIDYNLKPFHQIVSGKSFVKAFGGLSQADGYVLSRPPKGYDASNPALPYLKFKSFIAQCPLPDADMLHKDVAKTITGQYKLMFPFIRFLNEALLQQEEEA